MLTKDDKGALQVKEIVNLRENFHKMHFTLTRLYIRTPNAGDLEGGVP